MPRHLRLLVSALLCGVLLCAPTASAQPGSYDPSWYDSGQPHLQIAVTADGVYRIEASALSSALPSGTSLSDISPSTIRLIENGDEIPIQLEGTGDGQLDPNDTITFVGQKNRGNDELWAYNWNSAAQSSEYRSLYSDTTYYWMTWGGANGLRYQEQSSTGNSATTSSIRDTAQVERDERYYFGRPDENGSPMYTFSEGYYWRRFQHNDTSPLTFSHTLPVERRTDDGSVQMDVSVRLDAETNSCHRVEVEGLLQSGGSTSYETLKTVEWSGLSRRTVRFAVDQDRVPNSGLELRLTSYNDNFADSNCPDPSSTPNYVLLDWVEAAYTRTLEAKNGRQRFVSQATSQTTFGLSGYSDATVHVYNERDADHFEASVANGPTITDSPSEAPTTYWVVEPSAFRSPAAVIPDQSSNWSASSNSADYIILTTEALRPAAQSLANYRASRNGYEVEIVMVENLFDEFDYGRPTPVAIRRFVRATQDWSVSPEFLTIFADAQYPIRDGSVDTLYPAWSVPSFGYSPSDGWFGMQTDSRSDWSEALAIGRIPVRSVEQGDLFVEKLKTYERAPLDRWQKDMLLLAGGTTQSEQQSLQSYSNWWGEIASDTVASTPGYSGPAYTGMDTLRYYKNVNDALDASFQDSLSVDLEEGAGWLNYFGHSSAQTWEIVTDPPSEFGNAGRLPIVVSLGCRTGSFAGGRFEEKTAPSLGEQLVVGSVRPDGTPRQGTKNGGIAHFGESALGSRIPSARINNALIRRVFVDTMRVLGEAIRTAKSDIDGQYGSNDFYVKHLLQYGLLGDPATKMALPDQPDLHVSSDLISIKPIAPTPSEEVTVSVEVQSRGLIPSDSVRVRLSWKRPDGTTTHRSRSVERFTLKRTLTFSFSPGEESIGPNTFRVTVDPNDEYPELNETDNTAERTQTIFNTGVSLISPAPYGTVNPQDPVLEFSVFRRKPEPVSVVTQIDTVASFSSPFLREDRHQVDDIMGVWRFDYLEPGRSYYWRARTTETGGDAWETSQFTVAPDVPAGSWLQRGRLFSVNEMNLVNRSNRQWSFQRYPREVLIRSNFGDADRTHGFIIDGTDRYEYLQFGFGVLVMDGLTGAVKASESFPTYDLEDQYEDDVGDQQQAIDALASFLDNKVEEGDYVFTRTRHLARESGPTIPDRVQSLFANLGTTSTPGAPYSEVMATHDSLSYNNLWTMKARKGHPDATVEQVRPDTNQIGQEARLTFPQASGTTVTPRIGPASDWDELTWTGRADASDVLQIDVLSADSTVLLGSLSPSSGRQSLSSIDAETHPYLRLRASFTDSTNRTAPQLDRWSVAYRPTPELAVDPAGLQSLPDTLQQGAGGTVSLPVMNIGTVPTTTVRVHHTVTSAANQEMPLTTDTLRVLAPGERDTTHARVSTDDLPGQNVLTSSAESDGGPERHPSNNVAVRSFFVERDETPPSVRVLSNDREIPATTEAINDLQDPNLPFVSADPSFEIILEDNNPNIPLDDTSHADVYLKGGLPSRGPSVIQPFRRIPFASDRLTLTSTDTSDASTMRMRLEPSLSSADSTYTVKVEGRDANGNEVEPYQASFRVQTDQIIWDVYPYPNPMSQHTTFAFRVEGGQDEMLHDFRLRIYTLSGRLVRELDETDLDTPLGVGWNKARWNGRDADGDPVATGVYLYRVRVEGTDQTFRGDVEKVTVIR